VSTPANPFERLHERSRSEAEKFLAENPDLRAVVVKSAGLYEWMGSGGRRDELLDLVRNTPEWKPDQFDGAGLLDKIANFVRRFVSLSEAQVIAVSLWVVHTHSFSAADCTPYLAVTSAEKESGKTRLLEVLQNLVPNPWFTGRVTAAVLVRKIDKESPTLLLDEGDTAFGSEKEYAEALRGVLNTGYQRDGKASCCVGQGGNITFQDFSTFCPKAIAGIGELPDTVASRAIPIRLKRAKRTEDVERFRRREVEAEATSLRELTAAWTGSILDKLRDARPQLPEELTDRQQDVAEPLLAIADMAGGEWPRSARWALVELCAQARMSNQSMGEQLLADIKQILDARALDGISSFDLAAALAEIETSSWSEYGKTGKPITAAKLARLLGRYDITPRPIRIGDKTPRGYMLDDFADAIERHLGVAPSASPQVQSATTQQKEANVLEKLELEPGAPASSKCNTGLSMTIKTCEKPNENAACGVVAHLPLSLETDEDEVVL